MLRRILGPTNRRVRVFVGLMLLALICIQCVPGGENHIAKVANAINPSETHEQVLDRVRELAKTDHIALLEYCLANCHKKYGDFEANFVKQERLGGKVGLEQEMRVKHRVAPYSVAMAWTKNPPLGDRVLFEEGKFGNMMLVRPSNSFAAKLFPTVRKQPDGEEAMASTLRPVNQFGFERSIKSLIEVYQQAKQAGDLREEVEQDHEVLGRKTIMLVRYLPEGKGYPSYQTNIYIDQELLLPIMVEGCGPRGIEDDFICRYIYKDINFKAKFTDEDFLPEKNDLVTPK
jgi:hypothetical protein